MTVAAYTIDPAMLRRGAEPPDLPLAIIDLSDGQSAADPIAVPPYPVIGLGDRDHPLAAALDCVVEPPVSAEALARSICAQPVAASVVTQLLRLLPALDAGAGLTAESLAYAVLQGSAAHRQWLAARPAAPQHRPGALAMSREEGTLLLELDRTTSGNAIDRSLRDALGEAFALAALDDEITRVVLTGRGKCFSLGADLAEFGTTTDPATAHAIRMGTLPARALLPCADKLEVRVQGACVGAGLELAAFARRIVAAPGAWFQLPELAMGILPGAGGCVALTRRIGRQRAALMILSGRRISARVALEWGLVDELTGDDGGAHVG